MNAKQKAKDLIALAVDERTPDKERAVAAMKAISLIHKHALLDSALDRLVTDDETVQAAVNIFEQVTNPDLVKSLKTLFRSARSRRRRRSG